VKEVHLWPSANDFIVTVTGNSHVPMFWLIHLPTSRVSRAISHVKLTRLTDQYLQWNTDWGEETVSLKSWFRFAIYIYSSLLVLRIELVVNTKFYYRVQALQKVCSCYYFP